jgi:cysteine desulfurase
LFDVPGDVLVMALDLKGFAVSTGSACSSGAHKQSAVVQAMGRSGAPVRFSLGPDSDISMLAERLPDVVASVRSAF